MARANESPTVDVLAGAAALDDDIPRVLRALDAASIESLGWSRPSKIVLLIPMSGTFGGKTDSFLLRLGFQAYRRWPPSAQFVNPETLAYAHPLDQHHVPRLASNECQTHVEYQRQPGAPKIQLICCSATLEFYDVLHGVEAHHLWRDTDTFLKTVNAIQRAFASSYQGRFPTYGQ